MTMIVAKFGGSSMATGESIKRVAAILEVNSARKVCVVSAPGKRLGCLKMTDLLRYDEITACEERIGQLIEELHLDQRDIDIVMKVLSQRCVSQSEMVRMSFGEWLSAYLLSRVTGRQLIDATDVFHINNNDVCINVCWRESSNVIVPGFYGTNIQTGNITLFPRGGSDISASLIAQAIQADLCENWTDVSGVYDKDPRKHPRAYQYKTLDYPTMHALALNGAQVIHHAAIPPLAAANIPLRIMNTFAPHESGTTVKRRGP